MNAIRRFLAETDFRDLMYFALSFVLPFAGGFAGAWLALNSGARSCGVYP
jgi:hypothetical protein